MSHSLNEITAQARKAARGAGYAWAMADEAGGAVRWLCAQGVDGCAGLAAVLSALEARAPHALVPVIADATWRSAGEFLCPIHTGTALSDRAGWFDAAHPALTLRSVLCPSLLLPFVAQVSAQVEAPLTVHLGRAAYVVEPDMLDPPVNLPVGPCDLRIVRGDIAAKRRAHRARATPDAEAWATLGQFAHRTYAPATEASRLKGAGGSLNDSD